MAYDTNASIVPFAITGNYKFRSKNLKIVFGKPISILTSNLEQENEKLRNIIIKMVGDK